MLPSSKQALASKQTAPDMAPAVLRLGELKVSQQVSPLESSVQLEFPAEDHGESLAELAERDLDATLQLLADRAQYITGASGAAIALRQPGETEMLCRASAGTNAPELGALLSTEHGLSGESVRTRQPLRCDNAEQDPRVNRESCRALGIASVAVMPVLSDGEVSGVFELFSGQPNAFGERDVSALQRLAEMVDTAARYAKAAQNFPQAIAGAEEPLQEEPAKVESIEVPLPQDFTKTKAGPVRLQPTSPLLWSAAPTESSEDNAPALDYSNVPAALRELRKCEACGFPVSEKRQLCLDCEDKKSRGKLQRASSAAPAQTAKASAPDPQPVTTVSAPPETQHATAVGRTEIPSSSQKTTEPPLRSDMPIFATTLEPAPSWWSAHKYVLGAIVAAALATGAVLYFH